MIDTSDNPEIRDEHFMIPKRVVLSGVERRPAVVRVDESVWEGSNLKGRGHLSQMNAVLRVHMLFNRNKYDELTVLILVCVRDNGTVIAAFVSTLTV